MMTESIVSKATAEPRLSSEAHQTKASKRDSRIDYIDGLRAVAALAVVFLHAFQMRGYTLEPVLTLPPDLAPSDTTLGSLLAMLYEVGGSLGLYAVKVFIVISGYTLMIGAAKAADGRPKGGLKGYFQRRIRRIWPPYYVALIVSLAIIFLVPGMNTEFGGYRDQHIPVTADGFLAHLFFLQNFTPEWSLQINTPLWTIAVEEQIYIIFPFLLLPLWRRFPSAVLPLVAMLVPIVLSFVLPYRNFLEIRPWFLILFSFGAWGSSISFSKRPQDVRWRDRLPWPLIAAGFLVIWAGLKVMLPRLLGANAPEGYITDPVSDPFLAGAVASMMVHWTKVWQRGIPKFSALAVLNWRPLVFIGVFSYSLYLMHAPFQSVLTELLRTLGINNDLFFVLMLFPGIPVILVMTYIFHVLFERPFMPQSVRTTKEAETQAALEQSVP
jgi:peptidoglycan/LPS O-acetylase OafA/YrhL